ncbi:MAG: hypothetical protein KME49_17865 [Brasilonema octagenarum HA4186-MV1]|nr:hypothetical protein [Brasilonema octagenarum HA4186-MV1]
MPQRGEPAQGTTLGSAGLTKYLCRETLIKYWLPPGSPVAYGGKPACSAGFTARHNSWQRWIHRKALLWAQKWHMRETLPRALDSPDA